MLAFAFGFPCSPLPWAFHAHLSHGVPMLTCCKVVERREEATEGGGPEHPPLPRPCAADPPEEPLERVPAAEDVAVREIDLLTHGGGVWVGATLDSRSVRLPRCFKAYLGPFQFCQFVLHLIVSLHYMLTVLRAYIGTRI